MVNGGGKGAKGGGKAREGGGGSGGASKAAAGGGGATATATRLGDITDATQRSGIASALKVARAIKDPDLRAELVSGLKDARVKMRSDATRTIAASPAVQARVDQAFKAADRANKGSNLVKLSDVRKQLSDIPRPVVDAAIRASRVSGKYSLDSHEGLTGKLTRSERRASIREAGSRLVYISAR